MAVSLAFFEFLQAACININRRSEAKGGIAGASSFSVPGTFPRLAEISSTVAREDYKVAGFFRIRCDALAAKFFFTYTFKISRYCPPVSVEHRSLFIIYISEMQEPLEFINI